MHPTGYVALMAALSRSNSLATMSNTLKYLRKFFSSPGGTGRFELLRAPLGIKAATVIRMLLNIALTHPSRKPAPPLGVVARRIQEQFGVGCNIIHQDAEIWGDRKIYSTGHTATLGLCIA